MSLTLSAQTFTTLCNFRSQDNAYDGTLPVGSVLLGPQGELYGTTWSGGRWSAGTVYELLPPASPGGAWTEVVLHSFKGEDGGFPLAGLVMGPNGTLYGVTQTGGRGFGNAFKLDPPTGTSTQWPYTVIYQFTEADGTPSGSLVFGSHLGYGQSLYGNASVRGGSATVYRLTPPPVAGGVWSKMTLYAFPGGSRGTLPTGSLAVGSAGTLFGVTSDGGYVGEGCGYRDGCGTVFSLTPPAQAGGPWTEGVLHAFNPGIGDGAVPGAGVIIGPGGMLYGTTVFGGEGNYGTVFSLTPPVAPGAPVTETILYALLGFGNPNALVLRTNGVLYGTTSASVFELAPPASPGGSWTQTTLHSFTIGMGGGYPNGLTLAPDGTLYGTAENGGTMGGGIVFALTP